MMSKSALEFLLLEEIRDRNLPEPEREYEFHEPEPGQKRRRWRFDMAYPEKKIGIECEGGSWDRGREAKKSGFEADCRKYAQANLQGWCVFRFTGSMIQGGEAIAILARALEVDGKPSL